MNPSNSRLDGFSEKIEREFCEGSAIAQPLFNTAVRVVEDTGFWEPNVALNQHVSRFYETRRPHHFSAIAFFQQEVGELWQGKPECPRIDPKKDTPIKYENPAGIGARGYLPPVPPEIRQTIGDRFGCGIPLEGSFWEWLEQHPEIPVILTEGGKKALCLLSLGYVAIALTGVYGGHVVNETIAGQKVRLAAPHLIPDLDRFAAPGRRFILAFDQDAKQETRERVDIAIHGLSALLTQSGSLAQIASWDGATGKGIDDYCVADGAAAVEQTLDGAVSFEEWAIARNIARRVRRRPNLNIGDSEFIEYADSLPTAGILALYGGKGTAKSKAIHALIKERFWLSVAPLQSIAREQAENWGGAFVNDGDSFNGMLLNEHNQPVKGGSVCPPSLLKVLKVECDVLVLDELVAALRFLLESRLANKDGIRPLLLTELERRIKTARLVILADADLTEEAIAFVENIRGERAFLVRSERKPLTWQASIIDGSEREAIAQFLEQAEALPDDKVIYLNSDSKALVNTLVGLLTERGIKSLPITQDTSSGDIERSFLASKGHDLPLLVRDGVKVILSSPSVTQGFSIEQNTNLVDSVWGIYQGVSISADAIAQAMDRVRSMVPRTLWVAKKGRAYSRISRATNAREFLREFKSASTATARIARLSLKPSTARTADGIDWESEHLRLLAELEAARNRGMVALRSTVVALLKHEGKRIEFIPPAVSPVDVELLGAEIRKLREKAEQERMNAMLKERDISDDEAAALERKAQTEVLSPSEANCLKKFYLRRFYRVETVTAALVVGDRNGKTQTEIINLETALDEAAALERSARSIEKSPTTPQDWNPAALRRWLLAQSGGLKLIQDIWSSQIEELREELWRPVAQAMQRHSREFKIAFKFSNIDKVEPFQAIATLLDWCGIKRIRHRRRMGKEVLSFYTIDSAHLERVRAIVRRRAQADPPPQESDFYQGGGSVPDWDALRTVITFAIQRGEFQPQQVPDLEEHGTAISMATSRPAVEVLPHLVTEWRFLSPEVKADLCEMWDTADAENLFLILRDIWALVDSLRRAAA